MPELPEVQTTVNGINQKVAGLVIKDVWTDYGSAHHTGKDNIKDPVYFSNFKKTVVGATIKNASRKAKNILIHLALAKKPGVRPVTKVVASKKLKNKSVDQTILIHMKMTGHIMYGEYQFNKIIVGKKINTHSIKGHDAWTAKKDGPLKDPFNRFIHLVFMLSNGKHLVLSDMRKFAKVTLIETSDIESGNNKHLLGIGPEPLEPDFTYEVFKKRILIRPTGRIKNVLMDQALIAGVGNIYSDEALWRAGIHPEQSPKSISDEKLKKLYAGVIEVLKKGIDFGGDSMSDYRNIDGEPGKFQSHHEAYRRTKKPCRKKGCDGTIVRKMVGGRSAHFCDTHQKLHT